MKGQNTIHYQNKSAINLIGCQVSDMARSMKCKNSKKDFTFSSYICKYIVLSDSNSRLWQATMKIIRTILFLSMIIFLFFASESKSLNAIEEPAKGIMARPDEPCRTNPIASWTPQEKWVWEQVCVGKIADLGIIKAVVGTLTQKETKEWSEKSVLRPAFLETILLHEPYRGAITRHGVRIVGAWFKETLDLSNATLSHPLSLLNSRFDSMVDLSRMQSLSYLSLHGSKFKGKLDMNSIEVTGSLFMGKDPECENAAEFEKEVDLRSAKIDGQLNMIGSKFKGNLDMDRIEVASSVLMRGGAEFKGQIDLIFAEIGCSLDISQSTFTSFDITGSQINKEFRFGSEKHPALKWKKGAKLTLRDTHVGTLQDLPDSWPDELQLDGFTYSHFSGFPAGDNYSMATRNVEWMKQWLKKQKTYSPQPYEQLASVLKRAGYKNKAIDILVAGRDEERKAAPWLDRVGLFFLKWIIGYGYHNFYAFAWVCGFILIGFLFIWQNQRKTKSIAWCFIFSLDMLLPIIELEKENYQINLSGFVKYYFYIHKLVGYILATFLIAGITGLSK